MHFAGKKFKKWLTMKALASYTHAYDTGDVIFREGDPGHTAFIIERGRVEVSIMQNDQKLVLTEYDTGDLFGEMALIDDISRSATIIALEPTEVIAIDRSLFDKVFDNAHPLMNLFMHTMLHNLRKTNRLLADKVVTPGYLATKTKFSTKFQHARNETVYLVKAENELTRAMADSEFELHFQPIINTTNKKIDGFESLIRWQHPERGMVAPDEFITLAEQTGLIKQLGDWIINEACRQLRSMMDQCPKIFDAKPDFFVSVNLSAKQFVFPTLVSQVNNSLQQYKLSPENIKFEITESILMDNPETALVILEKFREQGFRIAIDDFGTGYSSLSYLHNFPIDTLKVDRSFVNSMQSNSTSESIVNAIIGLAKSIGLTVIAEGVETAEQYDILSKQSCDYVQGYYLHRPLPFDNIIELLNEQLK